MKKITRVPAVLIIFAFVFSWQIQCFEYPSGLHTNDLCLLCLWWSVYSVGLRSKPCAAAHSHNKCSVPPTQTGLWYAWITYDGQNFARRCPLFSIQQAYAPLHKHRTRPVKGTTSNKTTAERHSSLQLCVYMCAGGLLNKTEWCYKGGWKKRWSVLKKRPKQDVMDSGDPRVRTRFEIWNPAALLISCVTLVKLFSFSELPYSH